MKITTATTVVGDIGPLTKAVNDFTAAQAAVMTKGVQTPEDWEPVAEHLDRDTFKRVGAYLEELDWPAYREFLTGWVAGGTRFEFTIFQVSEVGNSVFLSLIHI